MWSFFPFSHSSYELFENKLYLWFIFAFIERHITKNVTECNMEDAQVNLATLMNRCGCVLGWRLILLIYKLITLKISLYPKTTLLLIWKIDIDNKDFSKGQNKLNFYTFCNLLKILKRTWQIKFWLTKISMSNIQII